MPAHEPRFLTRHRLAELLLAVAVSLSCPASTWAEDPLLPDEALLRLQIAPLESLYESSLVEQVWSLLQASRSIQEALETVEARNLQTTVASLEQQLGRSAQEIYASLSAGGIEVGLGVEQKPWLLIVAHTSDDQLPADVVRLAVERAKADGAEVGSGEHRGFTGYQLGPVMIAAVGPRLLIGSNAELLKAAVDRILDPGVAMPVAGADRPFQISARIDLERLRAIPGVAEGIKLPAADGGLMTFLGGWVDLLRRHKSAEFHLTLADGGIDSALRFSGGEGPSPPSLAGYWAEGPDEQPAPPVILPGMIYSTTWYRDYAALWDRREQLVTPEVVEAMEQADADAAAQFEALGSAVSLSEVVRQCGPGFRMVVAEQSAPPYDVELRNQLPAAAFIVQLKDEAAFREMADPLTRVLHLILSFEQKITSETLEHSGAILAQLSLPHAANDVRRRDRAAYNFRPTHTITRGHFILGSTPEIVRQTIDALDAQASAPAEPLEAGVTSRQVVVYTRLADGLERMRDAVVRQMVLANGLDADTADDELDVVISVLRLFDTQTLTGVFANEDFEYRMMVQPSSGNQRTPGHRSRDSEP